MKIAVDAWGGDYAPVEILKGIKNAVLDDLELVVIGSKQKLSPLYIELNMEEDRFPIEDTPQVIEMKEHPAEAIRKKPQSTIVRGVQLLAQKKIDAFISAGNSGALMAAAWFGLQRIADIERPAIATLIPNVKSSTVLLDVGANVDCKPKQLLHFGVMGAEYAKAALNIERPRVGLLTIGEEEGKGNELVKSAYQYFKNRCDFLNFEFIGNVEGQDIVDGKADVVVCDGFTGDALLKFGEGLLEFINNMLFLHITDEQLRKRLKEVWKRFDRSEIGGAPLLGVEGICMVCHGKSQARDLTSAIFRAKDLVEQKMAERIRDGLSHLNYIQ
jgi:glycerol-3-phosphate acyltransferase PlsX